MLKIVTSDLVLSDKSLLEIKEDDHSYLLNQYIQSHHIRNHSIRTIEKEKRFLCSWFQNYPAFFVMDAMIKNIGRERILEYANALLEADISHKTMRSNLGILSRFFSFILEHPYVKRGAEFIRIDAIYGQISQPISEYDIPKHTYDGEQVGVPMDPEELLNFYECIKEKYLLTADSHSAVIRARYYSMAIIAGCCGFRIDEIINLDIKRDIFFKSAKIQTRYAKGTSGSGKRSRITLFPALARDSLRFYIDNYRDRLFVGETDLLFPNSTGGTLSHTAANTALNEMIKIANKNNFNVSKHMSWHWFRRIFATRFIEQHPHQLSILISLLGHTSPNTVHKYIRHSEAWMDKKILRALQGDFI
ncbi:MAG: site-specific recombinase XerD [Flavobacteriaceae bacterium]|jgi:site-specific recombinase XerD